MPKSLQYARSKGKAIKYNQYWRDKQTAIRIAEDMLGHLLSPYCRIPKQNTEEDDCVRAWCIRCNNYVELNMTKEKLSGKVLLEHCKGESNV